MMQCTEDCVAVLTARSSELWLRLASCELAGLPATSIKQQATESTGQSNILYLNKHRENWSYKSRLQSLMSLT